MKIEQRFLKEFNLLFNVDLIHYNDHERLIADARLLGQEVATWPEASDINQQLELVLTRRSPEDVNQFINATDVDWYFNSDSEKLLFVILTEIKEQIP